MSFATRLAVARCERECDEEESRERSEAVYQESVVDRRCAEAEARAKEAEDKASGAKEVVGAKDGVKEASPPARGGERWKWSPPGAAAEAKHDGGGDGDLPGTAGHRFYPRRKKRSAEIVAAALDYWRDFWKQYDDPEMMELFDFESDHYDDFDPDADEHAHAHADLHREYRSLFERVLSNHLRDRHDVDGAAFAAELQRDLKSVDGDRAAKAAEFLEIVDKADDFAKFAESMREAVRQARWLEEPD